MANLPQVVKKKILHAFDFTPYPGDENLMAHRRVDDPECKDVLRAFKGKSWKDISVEMIRKYKEALPLFTPAAFHYYLPAYMIGCVDSYYDVDVALDSVLFNLTPPEPQSGWEWDLFQARAQQFNQGEREAIRLFLELMDQYQRDDWASEGMEPAHDRVGRALEFWT